MSDAAAVLDAAGGIDRAVHEPARLLVLSQLYVVEEADFLFLMRQTGLTQGNLSVHLGKLELCGYVELERGYAGKRPRTVLRITAEGRRALEEYIRTMKRLFDTVTLPERRRQK
jgi:DNA-binding MarR family transcriptional regulator